MPTIQSEDPNEKVNHPRHYNQHPSNIECIELIEHLPANIALATKHVWRCGLKQSEAPLRDLESAKWYLKREYERVGIYDLEDDPPLRTDIVWQALARKIIVADANSALAEYLRSLLRTDLSDMLEVVDSEIDRLRDADG